MVEQKSKGKGHDAVKNHDVTKVRDAKAKIPAEPEITNKEVAGNMLAFKQTDLNSIHK